MLYDKRQWIEDIDAVMTVVPELDELAGRSVLITGAAGLIYSAVVDVLFRYNDTHARGIHILAAGHRTEAMCVRLANMVDREGFQYAPYDVSRIDEALDVHADSSMGGQCLSRQGDSGARGDDVGQFHGIADLLEYVSC